MLPQPSADRKNINRLKKIAVTASVSVSAGLALIKLAASLYTGSLAVVDGRQSVGHFFVAYFLYCG